jgi:hypothetical protein
MMAGARQSLDRCRPGILAALALLASLCIWTAKLEAHNVGDSYLYLQIYEDSMTGRFEIALWDLNRALRLAGTPGEISPESLGDRAEFLKQYYLENVALYDSRGPLEIRFSEHRLLAVHGGYVLLPFELPGLESVPDKLTIEYSVLFDEDPSHRGFLLVEHNWATGTFANESGVSLMFSPSDRRQEFDVTSSGRWRGFLALVELGFENMWEGLDHLLFVFALLLPIGMRREDGVWQPAAGLAAAGVRAFKIITPFLVAYSLSFCLAALGWVHLPERLVETGIAASVLIVAGNLLMPFLGRRLWWSVFGLSLFHGFGFAGALADLGALSDHRELTILAFSLGVDLGLVLVVAILTPLVFFLARWGLYRRWLLPIGVVGMMLISGVWVIERAFQVDVPMRELLPKSVQKVIP